MGCVGMTADGQDANGSLTLYRQIISSLKGLQRIAEYTTTRNIMAIISLYKHIYMH